MIALLLPSFATIEEAIDWIDGHGTAIRVCLYRGHDGMIRGNALVRAP